MDELDSRTDCRLAFGPDNNYLAWSAHSSETYRTTPDEEEADDIAAEGGRIDIATFGVDWAYFYLWRDGRWEYNLKGHYRTLSKYLEDLDYHYSI
ncbi:hypothetical protein PG993_002617 [Apiospora rasikravindrae]|uniref:Uncharacterized protein n=1 Tax=Apiospora rasikravindrae TaxID=990691 RepID=A0ABR1TXK1_9PEZI